MRHLPALAAVVCLPLLACGGPDPEESSDAKPDPRQQLIGTYDTSGTLTLIENGVLSTYPTRETLELQASASRDALSLRLTSRNCGLEGKLSGARAFTLHGRSCALPPNDACTSTLSFSGGSGVMEEEGLAVSLEATLITHCGNRTTATAVSLELSGYRRQ